MEAERAFRTDVGWLVSRSRLAVASANYEVPTLGECGLKLAEVVDKVAWQDGRGWREFQTEAIALGVILEGWGGVRI